MAAAGAGAGADAGGEPRHVPAALLLQPAHQLQHHLHRTVALAVHSHDDDNDDDDDDDDGRYEEICHEQCGNNTLVIDSVRLQTEALTLITEDNDLDAVEYLVREASIIIHTSTPLRWKMQTLTSNLVNFPIVISQHSTLGQYWE